MLVLDGGEQLTIFYLTLSVSVSLAVFEVIITIGCADNCIIGLISFCLSEIPIFANVRDVYY